MGQQHAEVEARVKSLFPLNEVLVSEVHLDGSVIPNDVSASVLCRSQKGGSRVSCPRHYCLFCLLPPKKVDVCCWSCLFKLPLGYKSH